MLYYISLCYTIFDACYYKYWFCLKSVPLHVFFPLGSLWMYIGWATAMPSTQVCWIR